MPNSQELLLRIEAGDNAAARVLFDRYVERLVSLARTRVGARLRRRIDAEDVVQSAYRSFFVHAENREFKLSEAGDLWRLLARITLNKLYSQVEKHTAARRNMLREDSQANAVAGPVSEEPIAAEVIGLAEQLQIIANSLTGAERDVLREHLSGESVDAIAATIHKSPRTVRRLLEQTRNKIESYLKNGATTARTGVHSTMPLVADPRAQLAYSDYRLERLLGAGGMGKVYRATHLNTGNTVAIKALPRSRQADPNSVEKFLQEAQIS
jgi:RNA polymerase sigma factor (sigma-70 family)